jgi:hypothetical protein
MSAYAYPRLDELESAASVIRFAEEAQCYIEIEQVRKGSFSEADLSRFDLRLDSAATRVFNEQSVALSGIYKLYGFNEKGPDTADVSLTQGIIPGRSMGFKVRPIDEFEPGVTLDRDFEEEQRLFNRIRQRAFGDYVVCHLINVDNKSIGTEDSGLAINARYQALAPIMSSDLYVYGANQAGVNEEALSNANIILGGLNGPSRRALREIDELGLEGGSLESFVQASEPIDEFIYQNEKNTAVLNALRSYLANLFGPGICEPILFFDLPIVLAEIEGEFKPAYIDCSAVRPCYAEDIVIDKKFYQNTKSKKVNQYKGRGKTVYIEFNQILTSSIQSTIRVPISDIQQGTFLSMSQVAETARSNAGQV